jgi:hypothetical protein
MPTFSPEITSRWIVPAETQALKFLLSRQSWLFLKDKTVLIFCRWLFEKIAAHRQFADKQR